MGWLPLSALGIGDTLWKGKNDTPSCGSVEIPCQQP